MTRRDWSGRRSSRSSPRTLEELRRWPRLLERVQPYGVQSLLLAAADHGPASAGSAGLHVASSRRRTTDADVHFLQLVVNQVAVAVENALAFQEIEALKDKLAKEKAYLEEEVRTEHEFGDIIGESPRSLPSSRRSRRSPPPTPPSWSAGKPARARNSLPGRCMT